MGSGDLIGATAIPVKRIHRTNIELTGFFEEVITIRHNVGKIYEPFIRIREEGSSQWQTLPSIHQLGGTLATTVYGEVTSIEKDVITLTFWNSISMSLTGVCEVEIYFIGFTV